MAVVSEMPKAKVVGSMSLGEVREQLARFRRGGRMKAGDQARLERKMKEILSRLAKLGQKGGRFAQVRLSDEMRELYQRGRWA